MTTTPAQKNSGSAVRFLVTAGAFTAIYIVVLLLFGMLGFGGPIFILIAHTLSILFNGVVIALYLAKTRRFGAMTVLGLAVGLIAVSMGYFWGVIIGALLLGLCADLITKLGKYQSRLHDSVAYAVFSIWLALPYLPIIYASDAYFSNIKNQMGAAYADAMRNILSPTFVIIWGLVLFIIGFISGWFGTRIVAKHFAKAGMA